MQKPLLHLAYLLCLIMWGVNARGDDLAALQGRSADYPFDDELKVLAQDLTNPTYAKVLETMIPTDLEAEWQRVATRDNYQTFLAKHGPEAIDADPALKSAFEVRREIAQRFTSLIKSAYDKKKLRPPFDDKRVDELCAKATLAEVKSTLEGEVPIRALMPMEGAERHWPQFRGPAGQGIVLDARIPMRWSATENVLWKSLIPGKGNSSPVIWDDRLFITSASEDGGERWMLCYSIADGKLLWQQAAPTSSHQRETLYQKNSFASSTPVTDGERVISFFGNSGMVAFDMEGKLLWHTDLGRFPTMHGPGTSPVLHQDRVFLVQDQINADSVFVAIDKADGHILWREQRPRAMCWTTPILARTGQVDELIVNGSHAIVGYDPQTGKERWRAEGSSRESIPMPVIGGGWIYSVSGRNGPMYALRPGGTGNVTSSHIVWKRPRGGPHVPTPVWVNGRLLFVNDLGIATCLNAATGDVVWQKRLNGRFSMSVLSIGDVLLATNEDGLSYLFRAADAYEELAVNDLEETTLATPAIIGGRIYFRTAGHLVCVGEK